MASSSMRLLTGIDVSTVDISTLQGYVSYCTNSQAVGLGCRMAALQASKLPEQEIFAGRVLDFRFEIAGLGLGAMKRWLSSLRERRGTLSPTLFRFMEKRKPEDQATRGSAPPYSSSLARRYSAANHWVRGPWKKPSTTVAAVKRPRTQQLLRGIAKAGDGPARGSAWSGATRQTRNTVALIHPK